MKREILFRGKRVNGGEWVYGMTISNGTIKRKINNIFFEVAENKWVGVLPETLGQYTGLKDKNRKKIFEWDILFQGQELLGVVCISKRYGVSILKKATTWSLINFVLDSDFDAGVLSDIEVRGNVTDNPELLK